MNHREQNYEHENLAKNPPLHTPDTDGEISEKDREFKEFAGILFEGAWFQLTGEIVERSPLEEFRERMKIK